MTNVMRIMIFMRTLPSARFALERLIVAVVIARTVINANVGVGSAVRALQAEIPSRFSFSRCQTVLLYSSDLGLGRYAVSGLLTKSSMTATAALRFSRTSSGRSLRLMKSEARLLLPVGTHRLLFCCRTNIDTAVRIYPAPKQDQSLRRESHCLSRVVA